MIVFFLVILISLIRENVGIRVMVLLKVHLIGLIQEPAGESKGSTCCGGRGPARLLSDSGYHRQCPLQAL